MKVYSAGGRNNKYARRNAVTFSARFGTRRDQGGYILVAAIVVMLVLSGIALTLANLSISQNNVVEQAILRARTELALDSGAQWVTQATLALTDCLDESVSENNISFDETGKNVPDRNSSYDVNSRCNEQVYMEDGNPVSRFPTQLQADYKETLIDGGTRSLVVRRTVLEY